jgi:hypothetical protein
VHHLKKVLLAVLLLLPVSCVWADDRELYQADVCNKGQITVDVAIAYRDFGFNDEFWIIDFWWHVPAGECKIVFSHFYAPNNLLNFRPFPLHLAFAFTDSSGVWGAAMVKPPGDIARSHLKLCVTQGNHKYKNDDDPAAECRRNPNPEAFLIPASIDWEPTKGSTCCSSYVHEYGPPVRFTVALGPNDRAIPLGPRASTGGAAPTSGTPGGTRPAGSIPAPFGEGTLTAMLNGRKIIRWRGQVADRQWYYEDGSPVTRDRDMRGLTGVENSPLFDDTMYNARADRSKQTELMMAISHELEGPRGFHTAVITDDFGRFTYILLETGNKALGLSMGFEGSVQVAVHPYALDFQQARIEKGNKSDFAVVIPCRKGLSTRSAPAPTEAHDSCAQFRPIANDRLGDHLPFDWIIFAVRNEESGKIVISALRDLVQEMDKRFQRGSVQSR